MQITIIGAGNMARGIATRALSGGNTVRIIDRDPDEAARLAADLQENAAAADVQAADATSIGGAAIVPGPMTGTVVGRAGSEVCVRLAVSGWRIRRRLQPDGRTVIEVCDETGVLTGLVVGTRLPIVSADAGWRGKARGADGAKWWWALAIGHTLAGTGRPAVTFTRGMPGSRRARRTTVRPATTGGLWVAAVTGCYTTVCCQLTSPEPAHLTVAAQLACRLAPVTARHARW